MMSHCITELVLPQVSKHVVGLNILDVGDSPGLVKEMQRLSSRSVIDAFQSRKFLSLRKQKSFTRMTTESTSSKLCTSELQFPSSSL